MSSTLGDPATVRRRFEPGEIIFREEESASCAYIIERGRVEISTSVDERRRVLAELGPGEMFGEMAVLDGTVRSATATTLDETELTIILGEQLRSRVEAADPVLRLLLQVILNRFRNEKSLFRPLNGVPLEAVDFTAELSRIAIDKIKLESELHGALARNELELHYQPIVSLRSGAVEGFEALLRWRHQELGNIPPQRFIGLAEETALIVPIGQWVLENACDDLLEFEKSHKKHITMSVNVSGRQFAEPGFIGELATLIDSKSLDPAKLKLEITEGVLMDHRSAALGWIEQCKSLGALVALDDFGTGFSSLSYLASFPIDTLKIDRAFVMAMLEDARSLKIVRAISQLAHGIGLDVVAEGIEEPQQRRELERMRCEFGQGYLFSRPIRFEDALDFLAASPR